MTYEGAPYVVVGNRAHLMSEEDADRNREVTLCGLPVPGWIDRRGEPVCRRCSKRADALDRRWR